MENVPVQKKKNDNTVGGIIVIVVVLALLIWGISALFGGSGKKTPPSKPISTTTQTQPQSTASKVVAWDSQYGGVFNTLQGDFSTISKDSSNPDTSVILGDCQQLQLDVTDAQNKPAIPDPTIEQHWSSALSYMNSASTDCVDGINNNDSTLINKSASEITQATTEMTATNTAIQNVGQ